MSNTTKCDKCGTVIRTDKNNFGHLSITRWMTKSDKHVKGDAAINLCDNCTVEILVNLHIELDYYEPRGSQ